MKIDLYINNVTQSPLVGLTNSSNRYYMKYGYHVIKKKEIQIMSKNISDTNVSKDSIRQLAEILVTRYIEERMVRNDQMCNLY